LDTQSQQITRSGSYFAFAHYSKTMKRGAHIFASTGELTGVAHVAAENADGSHVLVITNNNSAEQRVQCTFASHALNVVLPADSITSFVWS
jgi:glucosylceramidase